jgi:hypothetical protein
MLRVGELKNTSSFKYISIFFRQYGPVRAVIQVEAANLKTPNRQHVMVLVVTNVSSRICKRVSIIILTRQRLIQFQ